jgi:heme/copper-type cytochrome/quinol oxidase subunit 2
VGYTHGSTALKVLVIVTPVLVLVIVIVLTVVDVRRMAEIDVVAFGDMEEYSI